MGACASDNEVLLTLLSKGGSILPARSVLPIRSTGVGLAEAASKGFVAVM
jgi:hypothetical protein